MGSFTFENDTEHMGSVQMCVLSAAWPATDERITEYEPRIAPQQ